MRTRQRVDGRDSRPCGGTFRRSQVGSPISGKLATDFYRSAITSKPHAYSRPALSDITGLKFFTRIFSQTLVDDGITEVTIPDRWGDGQCGYACFIGRCSEGYFRCSYSWQLFSSLSLPTPAFPRPTVRFSK